MTLLNNLGNAYTADLYNWHYEIDDDEDVKQIEAAVVQREVDKIINWETRKYESSSGT